MNKTTPLTQCLLLLALAAAPLALAGEGIERNAGSPFVVVGTVRDLRQLAGAHDVYVKGQFAYVTGKWNSFAIVDISDPSIPKITGSITAGIGDGGALLVVEDTCLVGADDLLVVDTSNPTHPAIIKKISHRTIHEINGMVQWGTYVLAASKSGYVNVFDAAKPSDPRFIGSLDTKRYGGIGAPHDIAILGDRIAIVDQRRGAPIKLRIYRVGEAETGTLWPINQWIIEGKLNDPAMDGANRIVVHGHYIAVASNYANTISTIDVSDPARPFLAAVINTSDIEPCGLTRNGSVLFASCERTIEAIDILDPYHPLSLGHVKAPELLLIGDPVTDDQRRSRGGGHDLAYRDGLLYVTGQSSNGLSIFQFRPAR
jgi:hypothetical protein